MASGQVSLPAMSSGTSGVSTEARPAGHRAADKTPRHRRPRLAPKTTLPPGPPSFHSSNTNTVHERTVVLYKPSGKESSRQVSWDKVLVGRPRNRDIPSESPVSTLRFPLLGPTRQETKLYFKQRQTARTAREDAEETAALTSTSLQILTSHDAPAASLDLGMSSSFDLTQIKAQLQGSGHLSRHNTLTDLYDLENRQQCVAEPETQEREPELARFSSLPNVCISSNSVVAGANPMSKSHSGLNMNRLHKSPVKILAPSKHGYHPRSHSPTYKFLHQVRLRLEGALHSLTELMLVKRDLDPYLEFDEFIDKHMLDELGLIDDVSEEPVDDDEDNVIGDSYACRSMQYGIISSRSRGVPGNASLHPGAIHIPVAQQEQEPIVFRPEGLRCLSTSSTSPSRRLRFDKSILIDNFPSPQTADVAVESGTDSSSSATRRLSVHLPVLNQTPSEDAFSINMESTRRVTSVEDTNGFRVTTDSRHSGVSARNVEDQLPSISGARFVRNEKHTKKKIPQTNLRNKRTGVNLESSDNAELGAVQQKVNEMDQRMRNKKRMPRKPVRHRTRKAKSNTQPGKEDQVEMDYEQLRQEQEEENSRSLVQVSDHNEGSNQNEGTNRDPNESSEDPERISKKPAQMNLNDLKFDRLKATSVTRLAKSSGLNLEETNDLYYTRDSKVISQKYIDRLNQMAFGSSDSEDSDDPSD